MKTNTSINAMLLMGLLSVSMSASCSENDNNNQQTQASSQATQSATPAQPTPAAAPSAEPPKAGRVSAIAVRERLICPESATLLKNGMYWGAPGGWRSFSQSFVNELTSFVEAQWHGVNVGKIMCVYAGKEARSFPVVLQNDLLVKMPTGSNWGDLKQGVVRCKSTNINDCPYFYTKRDVDIKKAYDEIDFKKGEKEDDLGDL